MKQKPILFTSDMLKAYDEDRKNCTRRIMKIQPINNNCKLLTIIGDAKNNGKLHWIDDEKIVSKIFNPPYQIGDHFWIKQNFQIRFRDKNRKTVYGYREDDSKFHDIKLTDREWLKFIKWKQPFAKKSKLFMFKSLAYKWGEVTNVRAERLQKISDYDIQKEGISINKNETYLGKWIALWNSINAKRGFPYDSNCWVWVISFKRINHG